MAQVGHAEGKCPVCGRVYRVRRPTDFLICDCYRFCPLCSPAYTVPMNPFTPDLTPSTYGAEEAFGISDTEESSGKMIDVLYVCYNHSPPHYSRQLPAQVILK